MKDFDLKLPENLDAAIGELPAEYTREGAQVLAGGQDIVTVMKDDIEQPAALVSLQRLGLDGIEWDGDGGVTLGATVTVQALADDAGLERAFPALREAAQSIGSPQIRSQATLGGNLNQRPRCPYYRHPSVSCFKKGGSVCLAEFGFNKYAAIFGGGPSYFSHPSDLATVLLMLGATASISGPGGERKVPLAELYVLPEESLETETVLRPDEILTSVTIPAPPRGDALELPEVQGAGLLRLCPRGGRRVGGPGRVRRGHRRPSRPRGRRPEAVGGPRGGARPHGEANGPRGVDRRWRRRRGGRRPARAQRLQGPPREGPGLPRP